MLGPHVLPLQDTNEGAPNIKHLQGETKKHHLSALQLWGGGAGSSRTTEHQTLTSMAPVSRHMEFTQSSRTLAIDPPC